MLEGDGAEAVVPLEKNTEWTSRVANLIVSHQQKTPYADTSVLDKLSEIANILKTERQQGIILNLSVNVENLNGNDKTSVDKLADELMTTLYSRILKEKLVY